MAMVTPRSSGVKAGGELLRYLPSSRRAHSEWDKIYPLQRMSMYGRRGCFRVIAFPVAWKL